LGLGGTGQKGLVRGRVGVRDRGGVGVGVGVRVRVGARARVRVGARVAGTYEPEAYSLTYYGTVQ